MQKRIKFILVVFNLLTATLIGRLYYWQVVKSEELTSQARAQHLFGQNIKAMRGNILASDGSWLAVSSDSWLMFAQPKELERSVREVANIVASLISETSEQNDVYNEAVRIEGMLSREDADWVPIKRDLNSDTKKNIEALRLSGIGFEFNEDRAYPEGSSSAQILGFVGKDEEGNNQGYFGLEGYYDLFLSGKPGFLERERSAAGVPFLGGRNNEVTAQRGVDLQTHIDKTLQFIVEKELKRGIEKYGAVAGVVIVMDPSDGGIMAMASYPSYDPSEYYKYGDEFFKNPAISDTFEPGSVFKPVVMAAALDAKAVDPDTECDICDGPYKIDKYEIKTWNNKYNPNSTMTEVIMNSDNVGMVFVGNKLGSEKLYDYFKRFGFGEITGIDLQGEVSSVLREKDKWSQVDLATATFGQGIAVTPIQMLKAIAIIARGGVEIAPQVVDKIIIDGWEDDIEPLEGERVISEKAASQITEMMINAALLGEAKWAIPKGFVIAGKTGTAQIPVSGHYDEDKTIGSFVGFAPARKPKFVMLVMLREPSSSPWASETAAPLWFDIAREFFPYLGVQPDN